MRRAWLYLALWLAVLLPASSKDGYVGGGGGGGGGVSGHSSTGNNSVGLPDVATHRAGNSRKKPPRPKEYDDFRRRFDEMAKGMDAVPGTDGALRYRSTPIPGTHESWHWTVKTEAGAIGNAGASANASLGNQSMGGNVNSHAEASGTGSASASASSSGSVTIDPGGVSVVSEPPLTPAPAPAPAAPETRATLTDAVVAEQRTPSIIFLAPSPRSPRILTTNDLPHSTFGGEVFDERAGALNYQSQEAAKGNAEALYAMGIRFLNGIDVSKNDVLAHDFLEAAKKKGNLRARAKLEELRVAKLRAAAETFDTLDK